MGDVANLMLNRTLCSTCGTYMGHDESGIPGYCSMHCATNSSMENVLEKIDSAISFLNSALEDLIELGKNKKAKRTKGVIKNLLVFRISME